MALFALVLLVAGQAGTAAPAGTADRAYGAVGRLQIAGRGFCTATLIAPRLVLTAAHCVTRDDGSLRAPDDLRFDAGLRAGVSNARRVASRVVVPDGYRPSLALTQIARDVALIQLRRPIGARQVDPLPVGRAAGRRVSVVSYAKDRADSPALQSACNMLGRREGAMLLDCAAGFGSSGAPVLSRAGGVTRIVAVISAKATADGRLVTLSTELDGVLPRLLARIPDAF
ncbi:trypsin-like serine peptidase [Palleronia rufa]|uniref:trypsin-like serine peptidase n=1 Tax=Palleronia rufa TaxID=1530186 RepID=UPI00137884BA|nr:trypsin-like peptidase domain-containing protein [Palleronia rufa]